MTVDPALARLAAAHGVAVTYEDQLRRPVQVAHESVVAVLAAMGVDASTPRAVEASLGVVGPAPATPPVVVLRRSAGARVPVAPVEVGAAAMLRLEDGSHRSVAGDGGRVVLPPGLPLGWHVLETADRETPVVVAPDRLPPRLRREWGWMVQLYAARSAASWGMGDIADLTTLARWTAQRGGGLVLVNPLHAVAPGAPMQPSPYYPASRRWTNPGYLRVEDTGEYAAAPPDVRAAVDALRVPSVGDRIDRDAAWRAKSAALELLWPYAADAPIDDDLRDFAVWCALCEVHGNDWRTWPEPLRHPDSPGVAQALADLSERVRFHAWLQRLCDDQLGRAQRVATDSGMSVGVVHDLAVGADPAGADAWALQDVLALRARIGAPPDSFNQQGQDWGMPPWHPRRLAQAAYRPVRDMMRALLRHGGGVRIDHVLGLFRIWWVPDGMTARDGTYVSYDADALLGVVTLEAERAGAMVVGEDLGTVPPAVARALADRGVLGSSVLWFEREEAEPGRVGALREPRDWRSAATASVTTHDLPTALGWLRGEHVRVRADLGLLDDPDAEQKSWEAERGELLDHLHACDVLPDPANATEEELVRALHAFLARTPSECVLATLGDAVGDLRQPNMPGTVDEYPNWRLPVADAEGRPMLLDDLLTDPRVERLAAVLSADVR